MLIVGVAWSASGGVAMHYVLPVLWMTSRFLTRTFWRRDATATASIAATYARPNTSGLVLHSFGCVLS